MSADPSPQPADALPDDSDRDTADPADGASPLHGAATVAEGGVEDGTSSPPSDDTIVGDSSGDPLLGKILADRYAIARLIARGGMGSVYEAWDRHLDSAVALKVIRQDMAESDKAIARFKR